MVNTLSSRSAVTGFDSRMDCAYVIQDAGTSKVKHVIIFFCF